MKNLLDDDPKLTKVNRRASWSSAANIHAHLNLDSDSVAHLSDYSVTGVALTTVCT